MNNLSEAIKNAGFSIANEFVPYDKISEERLPFGSLVTHDELGIHDTFYNDVLKSINFFRRNAEPFSIQEYAVRHKDYLFEYLKDHQDKCKVLPKPHVRKIPANGNLGLSTGFLENEWEHDAPYSTTNIVFKFSYSVQYETFDFHLKLEAFNRAIPEQRILLDTYRHEVGVYSFDKKNPDHKKAFDWFVLNVFPKCEFIPVDVHVEDGVIVSHRKYKDWAGVHDEVTSPCLGKNIKKHENYMKKLTKWFEKGGYIIDDQFYLIIRDRRSIDESYYLRPWDVIE